MNWDSFVPDLIVGGLTTGGIAWIVLSAEQRISNRRSRRLAFKAQDAAVDTARLLLEHELVFEADGLKPTSKNLRRLRRLVREVPPGRPEWPVLGFHFVEQSARTAETLQVVTDQIEEHIARFETKVRSPVFVQTTIRKHIADYASMPRLERWQDRFTEPDRVWVWQGLQNVIPHEVQLEIESDKELAQSIEGYIHARQLLSVYREAFIFAYDRGRSGAWNATLASAEGAPHNFVKKWWRERRRWKAVQAAWADAESVARRKVTQFDPYAY